MDNQTNEVVGNNIIEPSTVEYNIFLILVPKKAKKAEKNGG